MSHANLPKGPRFLFLHAWSFIYRPRRYYAWLRRRFGDIVTLHTPDATLVMALTPEGARQIFPADPDGYDPFQKQAFSGMSGADSLFVLDGSRHRRERQLLMTAFHPQRVHTYGQAVQEITLLHIDGWQPGQSHRAYDVMLDISRDVILRVVLGAEGGAMLDEGRKVLARVLHAAHPFLEFIPMFQTWWFPPWRRFQRAKDADSPGHNCNTLGVRSCGERT